MADVHRSPYGAEGEAVIMLSWALTFLVLALVAAMVGFTGVAGVATNIAWVLFVVFLIALVVGMLTGTRVP